jgi:hypothetical protein
MENFLNLFEQAIQRQVDLVGEEKALEQAKKAGLGVSRDGHIVSCTGNPQLVLMRLIRFFTAGSNMAALVECTPLIDELLNMSGEDLEIRDSVKAAKKELSDAN